MILPEPPRIDLSLRRQGAVETLNLIARSTREAVAGARAEGTPGVPDNFLAGQLMAYGQVLSCIERERDLLLQQLVQEAGLHVDPVVPVWDEELVLLRELPLTSEELFRLAMDFRHAAPPEPGASPEADPPAADGPPAGEAAAAEPAAPSPA